LADFCSCRYSEVVDVKILTRVGEALPDAIRGEVEMLELVAQDDMLEELYANGLGFATCRGYLAQMVKQLAHRYPRMRLLEIGP